PPRPPTHSRPSQHTPAPPNTLLLNSTASSNPPGPIPPRPRRTNARAHTHTPHTINNLLKHKMYKYFVNTLTHPHNITHTHTHTHKHTHTLTQSTSHLPLPNLTFFLTVVTRTNCVPSSSLLFSSALPSPLLSLPPLC